jgi:acetyltransferase-like isoleucine patch superfamily enzyme
MRVAPMGGRIVIGQRVSFVGGLEPIELTGSPGTTLTVGAYTVINYGTRILSNGGDVSVGARCLLGSDIGILGAPGCSTRVGDGVWIAHGAVVEGGVTVGEGSVVAAAAVVTRDVPPRSLAIGNPARAMSLDLVARERSNGSQ